MNATLTLWLILAASPPSKSDDWRQFWKFISPEKEHGVRVEPETGGPCARTERIIADTLEGLDPSATRFAEVRLEVAGSVSSDQIWHWLGESPTTERDMRQAARLLVRLRALGLFEKVTPRVSSEPTDAGTEAKVLRLALEEFPRVTSVVLRGFEENDEDDALEILLRRPRDEPACFAVTAEEEPSTNRGALGAEARRTRGQLVPGIVSAGLAARLEALIEHLRDNGYLLASLSATLSPQGLLTVDVDEGKLGALRVTGVPDWAESQVLAELNLTPGQTLVGDEVRQAVKRVKGRFEFLTASAAEAQVPQVVVLEERDTDGLRTYIARTTAQGDPLGKAKEHEEDARAPYVEGKTLVIPFRVRRPWFSVNLGTEGLHHSQVSSLAPGAEAVLRWWDSQGRVGVTGGGRANLNIGTPNQRLDANLGFSIAIPRLKLLELGAQRYSFNDSDDRWRVSNLDSYLNSLALNRSGRDYFRRNGLSAFATFQPSRQLAVGAEYRNERHGSLAGAQHFFSFFNGPEPAPNAAATPGQMGSVVLRLEASNGLRGTSWAGVDRPTTVRLFDVEQEPTGELRLSTLNTLEIADPALSGGDPTFRFVRFVSDSSASTRIRGVELKVRGRFGSAVNAPPQKSEALGGWGSVRGYDFKELGGDQSALATAQVKWHHFAAFMDVGAVRQPEGVITKAGTGVAVELGPVSLQAAWRLDERLRAVPEVRLLINQPLPF